MYSNYRINEFTLISELLCFITKIIVFWSVTLCFKNEKKCCNKTWTNCKHCLKTCSKPTLKAIWSWNVKPQSRHCITPWICEWGAVGKPWDRGPSSGCLARELPKAWTIRGVPGASLLSVRLVGCSGRHRGGSGNWLGWLDRLGQRHGAGGEAWSQ